MSNWVEAGVPRDPTLPENSLTQEELRELQRFIGERNTLLHQTLLVEQQMRLLLLVARDRRGLVGNLRVDAETGSIEKPDGRNNGEP